MDRIVGGGAAARLFMNLREVHGYTYGAYSQLVARRYAGPWVAQGSMRTDATGGAMTEFMNEINRIRDKAVPEKELEETKRSIVAGFALTLERPTELLDYAIALKVYNLPADYWDTYPAKIMAITAEQVQRVARKYIVPDDLQIVAVGDAAKLKPVLDKYGTVQVFDTQRRKPKEPRSCRRRQAWTIASSATRWARCASPPMRSTARRRSARSRISRSAACAFPARSFARWD